MGILSIGIDFFQVLAMFASTRVTWPQSIEKIYNWLSLFSFNIGITAPECAFTLYYKTKWWVTVSAPMGVGMIFVAVHIYKVSIKRFVKSKTGSKVNSHLHLLIGTALYGFYFVYLYLCQVTLDVFNCAPVVSDDGVRDYGESLGGKHGFLTSEPTEVSSMEREEGGRDRER